MNSKNLNGVMAYKHISNDEKDEMIRAYLPLVKKVVNRLLGRVPKEVDVKKVIIVFWTETNSIMMNKFKALKEKENW